MKKTKKLIMAIVIIILILLVVLTFIFTRDKNLNNTKKDNTYYKTLELAKDKNLYLEKFEKEYQAITYLEEENFLENVNAYLNIGYNAEEINSIFTLSANNKNKMLDLPKQDFIIYKDIKNFNISNIDRYNNYLKENNLDIQTAITHVNINLDKEFYTDSTLVTNPHAINTIINKFNHVDEDFVPNDLVTLFDNSNAKMVKEAALAYEKLITAAKEDNITLVSTTAYRSYSFQNLLYTNYVKKDGKELADTYSARPGSSEHQLGLAVDLNDPTVEGKRLDDKDYDWLLKNAHNYGFIVRYTESGVPITGYMEEPWHLRYLGVDLAKRVVESNLTYDEYYDLYIKEY